MKCSRHCYSMNNFHQIFNALTITLNFVTLIQYQWLSFNIQLHLKIFWTTQMISIPVLANPIFTNTLMKFPFKHWFHYFMKYYTSTCIILNTLCIFTFTWSLVISINETWITCVIDQLSKHVQFHQYEIITCINMKYFHKTIVFQITVKSGYSKGTFDTL